MQWVMKGGPWSFDNVMIALKTISAGEDPAQVKTWYVNIWIQLFNLPMGYMLEAVGKQLGNFFGEFIEYDAKNNSSIWRDCMRVRIGLDVRNQLSVRRKLLRKMVRRLLLHASMNVLVSSVFHVEWSHIQTGSVGIVVAVEARRMQRIGVVGSVHHRVGWQDKLKAGG